MKVQTYLFFDGRTEEAIAFYRKTLGAEVKGIVRFRDSPEQQPGTIPAGTEDKILHASFTIGETELMASDGQCQGKPAFHGFSLSLTASTEAEAERLFAALGDGGQVQVPLTQTFFSPRFGIVADRFGVSWMVHVVPA